MHARMYVCVMNLFLLQQLLGLQTVSYIAHRGLLSVKGDLWRRSRRILTPTFSTLKLKIVRRFHF